jgi:hypothetical protein
LELRIVPSTQRPERIVEGRTIATIEEMQEFCDAAVAAAHADPSALRLNIAQAMRVTETTLPDGRKVYDVRVSFA